MTPPGVIGFFHGVCCGLVKQVACGMSIVVADLSLRYCPGLVVVISPRGIPLALPKGVVAPILRESASTLRLSHPSPASLALFTRGPCTGPRSRPVQALLFPLVGLAVHRAMSPTPEVLPRDAAHAPPDRPRPCPRPRPSSTTPLNLLYTSITPREARGSPCAITGGSRAPGSGVAWAEHSESQRLRRAGLRRRAHRHRRPRPRRRPRRRGGEPSLSICPCSTFPISSLPLEHAPARRHVPTSPRSLVTPSGHRGRSPGTEVLAGNRRDAPVRKAAAPPTTPLSLAYGSRISCTRQ